ncbi:MAG: ribonuclease HI family protein [Planctomycetes bacterium]|nr:ribonuclease HI family protein [Planctomycetota bacterium]
MDWIIHIDGGSRGNPGPAGAGVVIAAQDGALIHEGAYFLGRQTNNAAEYYALIRALQRVQRGGQHTICVYTDSELLARQITGAYRVKSPKLKQFFEQVQYLLLQVPRWQIRHIPREHNQRADELANLAMDSQHDVVVFDVVDGASCDVPTESGAPLDPPPAAQQTRAKPVASLDEVQEGTRAVRVAVVAQPASEACPARGCPTEPFIVEATLPSELCLHAAHTLIPSILAIQNAAPQEFAAVPTLTMRCLRMGCGAVFNVSPVRSPNGSGRRDDE